jgi:hypothetical protein
MNQSKICSRKWDYAFDKLLQQNTKPFDVLASKSAIFMTIRLTCKLLNQAGCSLRRRISHKVATPESRSNCPDGSGTGWTVTVKVSPASEKSPPE